MYQLFNNNLQQDARERVCPLFDTLEKVQVYQ